MFGKSELKLLKTVLSMKNYGIFLLCFTALVFAGCRKHHPDSSDNNQIKLECPVEGVWGLGKDMGYDFYYVISIDPKDNSGIIGVESKGIEISSHQFDIIDSKTIHIRNATAECFQGDKMDGEGWNNLFQLKEPPKELTLTNKLPTDQDSEISNDLIYMSGLFSLEEGPFPIPLRRIKESERLLLPFEILIDWNVEIPKGVEMSIGGDGVWGAAMLANAKFKEPVHPIGYVRSLEIEGLPVSLKDGKLNEGKLSTKKFGEIEFFLLGPGNNTEVWVTRKQLKSFAEAVSEKLANQAEADKATAKLKVLSESMKTDDIAQIRDLIKAGADVNVKNEHDANLLMLASLRGHLEIVKLLLEYKADVNVRTEHGATPLWMGSQGGHTEVVKLLLRAKADVNVTAEKIGNSTPLHVASQNGHSEVVKLLLDAKADLNAAHTDGRTSLWMASQKGHIEIVKRLLKAGANVNVARNTDGVTPLFIGGVQGHTDVVKLLLEAKADVNAKASDGHTPLSIAKKQGYEDIIKLLTEQIAKEEAETVIPADNHKAEDTDTKKVLDAMQSTLSHLIAEQVQANAEITELQRKNIELGRKNNELTHENLEINAMVKALKSTVKKLMEENYSLKAGQATSKNNDLFTESQNTNTLVKGKITQVDKNNNIAAISLGSSNGVKLKDRLHVIREEKFICDIIITTVKTNEAIGILVLMTSFPNVGDIVTDEL